MIEPKALEGVLFDPPAEGRYPLAPSSGAVPAGLRGSYVLNGPSNLQRGSFRYRHWLDGDGLVRAVHFRSGTAELVARFVQTRKLVEESRAGEPLYRAFGTAFPGDRLRRRMALESPANVSVFSFGGKLLAFGEQAPPWELDPDSLETTGEFLFDGALLEISPFSAHPKIDEEKGLLANFGIKYGLRGTVFCYWEFDESFRKVTRREIPVPRPVSVHDFALSPNYASFYLSPYDLDIGSFVREGRSIHDALAWHKGQDNVLLVIPRDGAGEPLTLDLGPRGFCLHMIGAFERGGDLVVDLIETSEPLYPQYTPLPELFATVRPGAFVRMVVNVREGSLRTVETCPCPGDHLDFPVGLAPGAGEAGADTWVLALPVAPRGAPKYFDRLQRFNWGRGAVVDEYRAPRGCYLGGEPALVADPEGGAQGDLLIVPLWRAASRESEFLILRAFQLAKGPVAVLPAPVESPLGFHASFRVAD